MTTCCATAPRNVAAPLRPDDELARRLRPIIALSVRKALIGRRDAVQPYEPEDLEQEVWIALLDRDCRQLRSYQASRASLERYVFLIAQRVVSNRIRELRAQRRTPPEALPSEPTAPCAETRVATARALESITQHLCALLPARGQDVLVHLFAREATAPEVSRQLGVETQVVYNWQHRIRCLARQFREATGEA